MIDNNDQIAVSIICNTYNQEEYIKDALEGFINQKTNFNFEVLIHDDASTDNTKNIILRYEKKYPKIIKGYYEKENQYSKHDGTIGRIQRSRIKGKYVAYCEGDDYWTDIYKLQKQFDFLENNIDYSLCATYSKVINAKTGKEMFLFSQYENNKLFTIEDFIEEKNGRYFQLASIMIRSNIILNPSPWRLIFPIGDYPLFIEASLKGKIKVLPEITCVYRRFAKGSWTNTMKSSDNKYIEFKEKMIIGFLKLNEATNGIYKDIIQKKIDEANFSILLRKKQFNILKSMKYRSIYKKLKFRTKLKIFFQSFLGMFKKLYH